MQKRLTRNMHVDREFTDISVGVPTVDGCVMIDWCIDDPLGTPRIHLVSEDAHRLCLHPDEARAVAEALLDFVEFAES